jgi:hypothetical protein
MWIFLTLTPVGGEWSASHLAALPLVKDARYSLHRMLNGPRADLDDHSHIHFDGVAFN